MSTPYSRLFWLLIVSPVAIYIAHAIVSRIVGVAISKSIAPQMVALGIVLIGTIPMIWIAWEFALKDICRGAGEVICAIVYVLLTYGALAFWYFCFLNLGETSLHVHILMKLLVEGGMHSHELATRYSAAHMIDTRIERMIALGQLTERNGRYVLTGNAVLVTIGRLIDGWRSILCLPLQPEGPERR